MITEEKAMLIVISGPSGVGKGTLCKMLLEADRRTVFSVSATTRAPREGETDGKEYYFVTDEEFLSLKERGELLEDAVVHGHRYGTPLKPILDTIKDGHDVLLDIDTQGALNVMSKVPDCVSIFVLPPSWAALRARLLGRNTEKPEDVEIRLNNAVREVEQLAKYRYVIVNDDGPGGLERAFDELRSIVSAERHRTIRYTPHLNDR